MQVFVSSIEIFIFATTAIKKIKKKKKLKKKKKEVNSTLNFSAKNPVKSQKRNKIK